MWTSEEIDRQIVAVLGRSDTQGYAMLLRAMQTVESFSGVHSNVQLAAMAECSLATIQAARFQVGLGKYEGTGKRDWPAEERAKLAEMAATKTPDAGIADALGRTVRSVRGMRERLHLKTSKVYSPEEIEAIRRSPRSPGIQRSALAIAEKRRRLGITLRPIPAVIRQRPADVLTQISAAVPAGLPRHVRDEVIQDVVLGVFEGRYRIDKLREAIRDATRGTYRLFPVIGGPFSLDAPVFGDGPLLIERISAGLWQSSQGGPLAEAGDRRSDLRLPSRLLDAVGDVQPLFPD